jgi:DNA invertase Pin-like site-specific DNA recombinase
MLNNGKKPTGSRGVAYLRISGDKQDLTSQRQSIDRWLQLHGLTVQCYYEDVGSRDLAYKRESFQRLLRAVEAGLVDWIITDSKDRFGTRSAYEFGKFATFLQEHDCQLWSVTQGCLTDEDAVTEILAAVDSVRSRDEQKARSQRSLRGKIAAVQRNEFQGGYPPLGYDVGCFGKDGQLKWSVYYTGHHQRLRLWPDGRPPERYDGKGNFPARDKGDVLRLIPSHDKQRVEIVRQIFKWFATESITLRGLCTRLANLRISPVVGEGWYSSRLGPMLRNPAYLIGSGVWNKKGHGRFFEYRDGQYQEVPRIRGRAKTGRNRPQADYIRPLAEAQGLIDRHTWERVQARLAGKHRPEKAPRNPALWLAGLLYCGHCGRRLAGWHQKSDKTAPLSYCCANYRQYGKANPFGCQLHRVRAEVIEQLLERYLEESGQRLETLLRVEQEDQLLDALCTETDAKTRDYLKTLHRVWREVRGAGAEPPPGKPWSHSSLCDAYAVVSPPKRHTLAAQLQSKRDELDGMLRQFARLTNQAAIDRMNQLIEELGEKIKDLEARLQPLDELLRSQRANLQRLEQSMREARETLAGDSNRRKAAAVGRVLARIVCKFVYTKAGSQTRSILSEVTFEPLLGDARTFTLDADLRDGSQLGRG